jgi:Cu/Ag efflux protein CusF
MKLIRFISLLLSLTTAAWASEKNCGCACCKGKEVCCCHADEAAAAKDEGHALKGVVTKVLEERKLVMIKHEEIPGFMKAMTMAFSVPEEVWPQLKPGVALAGRMHKGEKGWKLTDVKIVTGAKE